ncbi:MAG: hypothetical protein IPP33_05810 [Flavobacteriales bacterium]|nr:hypothetical protein [Flavobacteriales bacterium]
MLYRTSPSDFADLPYTIYLQGERRNLHFRASMGTMEALRKVMDLRVEEWKAPEEVQRR